MNLLLLEPADLLEAGLASVSTARYPARRDWWPPQPGRRMRVGLRDGALGSGSVESVEAGRVQVRFTLDAPPPPPLPLQLLLALPRPKMLRRTLRTAAELGIKRIVLMNAARVEKSYWQSPLLAPDALQRALRDGLEQVCDSRMPAIELKPRLRPFVEDELPALAAHGERIIAHPAATPAPPRASGAPVTLAIGPEGGFTPFEVELFQRAGFTALSLGPRVYRCETALPVLAATLFPASGAVA